MRFRRAAGDTTLIGLSECSAHAFLENGRHASFQRDGLLCPALRLLLSRLGRLAVAAETKKLVYMSFSAKTVLPANLLLQRLMRTGGQGAVIKHGGPLLATVQKPGVDQDLQVVTESALAQVKNHAQF